MYILVRQSDNIIIGTSSGKVDEQSASKSGYRVYEIADVEWNNSMLGSKLKGYEKDK